MENKEVKIKKPRLSIPKSRLTILKEKIQKSTVAGENDVMKVDVLNNQLSLTPEQLREKIEKKAYELFEKRGYSHGRDIDDWFEARRIVMAEECLSSLMKTVRK